MPSAPASEEGPKDLVVPWSCCAFLLFCWLPYGPLSWMLSCGYSVHSVAASSTHRCSTSSPVALSTSCKAGHQCGSPANLSLPPHLHPPTFTPPVATAQDQGTEDQGGTLCICHDDSPRSSCGAASLSTVPSASAAAPGALLPLQSSLMQQLVQLPFWQQLQRLKGAGAGLPGFPSGAEEGANPQENLCWVSSGTT